MSFSMSSLHAEGRSQKSSRLPRTTAHFEDKPGIPETRSSADESRADSNTGAKKIPFDVVGKSQKRKHLSQDHANPQTSFSGGGPCPVGPLGAAAHIPIER